MKEYFNHRSDELELKVEKACESGNTQACSEAMGGIVEAWRRASSSMQYGAHVLTKCNGDSACVDIYIKHMRENIALINQYYATAFPNGEKGLRDAAIRYGFVSSEEAANLIYADLISTYNSNIAVTVATMSGIAGGREIPRVIRMPRTVSGRNNLMASTAAISGSRRSTADMVTVVTVRNLKGNIIFSNGVVNLRPTLNRIKNNGSYPHRNDGLIFRNDQNKLPLRPKEYYTEYVVPTSGTKGVGPQRIVTGKNGETYYTPDHYNTFIPLN